MSRQIKFGKSVHFLGRNGMFKSVGIDFMRFFATTNYVTVSPITSKNEVARCKIEIPVNEIDNFCNALKSFKVRVS